MKVDQFQVKISGEEIQFNVNLKDDGYGADYWSRLVLGEYEPDTICLIKRFSAPDYCFIDVGAANGAMSLIAAAMGCEVVTIEPNRQVFAVLKRNIALNPKISERIHPVNAILASDEDKALGNELIFERGILTEITREGADYKDFNNLEILNIEDVMRMTTKRKIFMKIDIEGAEWKLFQSRNFIKELIRKNITIIIALHPGLNRPLDRKLGNGLKIRKQPKVIWRLLNIRDSVCFFRRVSKFTIYKTNYTKVNDVRKFVMLILGGYHEFILVPKNK
jgi:FkbM family methyltransferase